MAITQISPFYYINTNVKEKIVLNKKRQTIIERAKEVKDFFKKEI